MIVFDQISAPGTSGYGVTGVIATDNFTLNSTTRMTGASFILGESLSFGVDDGIFDGFNGTLSLGIYTVDQNGKPQQLIYQVNDANVQITDIGTFTSTDLFLAEIVINNLVLPSGEYAVGIMEGQWLSPHDGTEIYYLTDAGSSDSKLAYMISFGEEQPIYTKLSENMSFAISGEVLPDTSPPTGTDKAITVDEDTLYTFSPADFGFADADGDTFVSIIIQSLPVAGLLALNGNAVGIGSDITVADISKLTFTPALNAYGAGYARFSFQVVDDGAASIDPVPNKITINVLGVNDAPIANDDSATVYEDELTEIYVLANDVDPDQVIPSILQTTKPLHGTLLTTAYTVAYKPDPNYFGADSFTYTIIDSGGITDTATVTLDVIGLSDAPVAGDDTFATLKDSALQLRAEELLANDVDVDGELISIASIGNATSGTAVLNPDGTITFTPSAGFSGIAGFDYVVRDPTNAKDTGHVQINVVEGEPVVSPSIQSIVTLQNVPVAVLVDASDPQNDPLSFEASAPAHGSITGGQEGAFVYAPDADFMGTDSFSFQVSDGEHIVTQIVYVEVTDKDEVPEWTLLAEQGFSGSLGGNGAIFGTNGFEDITVLDVPGHVYLDASFNRGENIVRLAGEASSWRIVQAGSSAIFSNGDTYVHLPAGTNGMPILFDDGVRTLFIDLQASTLKIGSQAFADILLAVTAQPEDAQLPSGANGAASGVLLLQADATVAASGKFSIYGNSGNETVHLSTGSAALDASFNKGGDTLLFDLPASSFKASQNGSAVFLDGVGIDVLIPVGTKGMTVEFAGNDDRALVIDMDVGAIFLGSQQIGVGAVELSSFA